MQLASNQKCEAEECSVCANGHMNIDDSAEELRRLTARVFLLLRENLPSRFKFKEYCPMVFRNLRERFCIDDQDYQVRHTHFDGGHLKNALTWEWKLDFFRSELSNEERAAQRRLPGSLRQPLPVQLRPPLYHQDRVQRGHRRDAQHPEEVSPGEESKESNVLDRGGGGRRVVQNLEKSWGFLMLIFRPGKVLEENYIPKVLEKSGYGKLV